MTPQERSRNLAKARKARQVKADRERRTRATAHRQADRRYRDRSASHHDALRVYGDGSREERREFRKLIKAEAEWFRTYPREAV